MGNKRKNINEKISNRAKNIDELFNNDYVNSPTNIEKDSVPTTPQEIREYYDNHVGGKQVSIYLPEEIHAYIKSKASAEQKSMKDAIKNVLIYQYLNDEEIIEVFNKKN